MYSVVNITIVAVFTGNITVVDLRKRVKGYFGRGVTVNTGLVGINIKSVGVSVLAI